MSSCSFALSLGAREVRNRQLLSLMYWIQVGSCFGGKGRGSSGGGGVGGSSGSGSSSGGGVGVGGAASGVGGGSSQ